MNPIKITPRCPIRTTLELIGGKLKLLILFQLNNGPLRLNILRKSIPDISEKKMIQELKTRIDSDLVNKKSYGEVPPRVEYSLSDNGRSVLALIEEMRKFGLVYNTKMNQ
ncbi:winged helix-turn-helix transcriptional regulator [Algoriphagus namhaensis]